MFSLLSIDWDVKPVIIRENLILNHSYDFSQDAHVGRDLFPPNPITHDPAKRPSLVLQPVHVSNVEGEEGILCRRLVYIIIMWAILLKYRDHRCFFPFSISLDEFLR